MKYVCSLIVVQDMTVARKFYEEVLKQQPEYDFGANVSYKGGFALHLAEHYQGLLGDFPIRFGGNDSELYFEEDELEPLAGRLKDAGAEFIHPIRPQPWQQQVMRFYDPDHHIVEVGESLEATVRRLYKEGKAPEEIVRLTGMPLEFVNTAI